MPIWVFVEFIDFGGLLLFTKYISETTGWKLPVDYGTLDRVRQIRNAAAHSNCIINDLTAGKDETGKLVKKSPLYITQFVRRCEIAKTTMDKKLSNPRISQLTHLLYGYTKIVKSENTKNLRYHELSDLVNIRMLVNQEFFKNNTLIVSSYEYFKKICDKMVDKC